MLFCSFASRLLAWILSRVAGATIRFRFGGWKCIRDLVVEFKKGAIESVSVGEIKLSLRRGKWMMVVANIARYLSVSITDLVLKMPKASIEVKELKVDISKDGQSKQNLIVKLQISPIVVQRSEPRVSCDQLSNFCTGGSLSASQSSSSMMDRSSALFICEDFALSCEFGHDREVGVIIKNVDVACGEIAVNLNEELLSKSKSSSHTSSQPDTAIGSTIDSVASKKPHKKQQMIATLSKYTSLCPEKVSFSLPKLDVRFVHREYDLSVENNIMGIQLKSIKSQSSEDVGETTRLDVQLDFSEIHLLREAGTSVLEILKVDVASLFYIPIQPTSPIRAEIDVKLGGTQCNVIMNRLKPWLRLHFSKKKRMVLREETSTLDKPPPTDTKAIMWTCTVSAPEMTIVLYSISGLPLYHGCSQSSHVFANNISNTGTSVHMELGELNLHMADEYQECLKESLFGVESNSGSLINVAKVSLDWGKKDMESSEEDGPKSKLVLSVDVTGMGVFFTFKRVESLISTAMSFQALLKNMSSFETRTSQSRGRSSKSSGKGTRLLKLNLERCSVKYCGEVGLENTVVADPKRVNYGSQGGRVVISNSDDGTPRVADVMSTISDKRKNLRYSISLDIFHLSLCVNKEKQSTQIELERARSVYQDHLEEHKPETKLALFDMQNAKFVRRSGGLKEVAVCSLFSATDITVRWEPDVQLSLVELGLQLKLLVHNQKLQGHGNEHMEDVMRGSEQKKEAIAEPVNLEKHKKKESIFAVDVEMLSIYAEVGMGLMQWFRVFKSSRMQISRIPSASCPSDAKVPISTTWDWVIQGLDVHICLPYRLQLRAIDDSVEEMLRALKLVIAARTSVIFPMKKDTSKPKKPSSIKFGSLKFCIRKITADIEEEPLQGWLDEHYQLMKNEASELAVRLKFLDECVSRINQFPKTTETIDSTQERLTFLNGVEIDVRDPSAVSKMQGEIYKQSFRSYYKACQNLAPSEGSGACREGIDGGDDGMIEVIKTLDPLRDYASPLLCGTSVKCEGRLVLAQQATSFQPQIHKEVYIGRWRKVNLLRSASGTTPPMKTFTDLSVHFQKAEVAFGVGYEPVFADVSYAFTVALRRANLSVRNPNPPPIPPKKEKNLPWWDDMRNYIHGNINLLFSETIFNILATTDPYEKLDKLQVITGSMEIQQSDGRVYVSANDFKIFLSSLESLANSRGLKLPKGISGALLEAPAFTVEVTIGWECESGNPMNHYLFAFPVEGRAREKVFDPFRSTSLSLRWTFSLRPSPSREKQGLYSTEAGSSDVDGTVYGPPHKDDNVPILSPTVNVGAHDLAWLIKFWNMNYLPPHKLRSFRWASFWSSKSS
ncbi:protein SABRE [Prunus yedoensis var. nudiflora]|uniref:Protein SABRE n=1 Tax=Prunus yedoensis var. nudiflora TaxID=2094558 RepID=A0A314YSG9_PRUYE|nr:protein SABRE [Prunus yedoensis var. nudiflora]